METSCQYKQFPAVKTNSGMEMPLEKKGEEHEYQKNIIDRRPASVPGHSTRSAAGGHGTRYPGLYQYRQHCRSRF
jgi:hypothetical protein